MRLHFLLRKKREKCAAFIPNYATHSDETFRCRDRCCWSERTTILSVRSRSPRCGNDCASRRIVQPCFLASRAKSSRIASTSVLHPSLFLQASTKSENCFIVNGNELGAPRFAARVPVRFTLRGRPRLRGSKSGTIFWKSTPCRCSVHTASCTSCGKVNNPRAFTAHLLCALQRSPRQRVKVSRVRLAGLAVAVDVIVQVPPVHPQRGRVAGARSASQSSQRWCRSPAPRS